MSKTYETKCPFCGTTHQTISKAYAVSGVCCGSAVCLSAYNAQAETAIAVAKANRKPRQPKRQPVIAGEWGMAILLSNPEARR